jgi:hypothetical protein
MQMLSTSPGSNAAGSVAIIFPYPTWHCTARHVITTKVEIIEQQGVVQITMTMSRLLNRRLLLLLLMSRDVKCATKTFRK